MPEPKTQVVHCKRESFDVYIGRPGKWGNPFRIGIHGTRGEVIKMFREWFSKQERLLKALPEVRGKRLGCHCDPLPCHGHVIAEFADRLP